MTAPLGFEVEETEGADLGSVFVAGQACASCGIPSYTGPRCTRCALAGASATGFWNTGKGEQKILAQNGAERVELVPAESVCPLPCGHDAPKPVKDLATFAFKADWRVMLGHSRGRAVGGNGRQLDLADLWSVRFRRGEWQGYAVRRGKVWDSVCIAGATLPPFLALGVTELRQWLADPERPGGEALDGWVTAIRKRLGDQALASKIVKCPGPGKCAWLAAHRSEDHTHRANGDIKIKTTRASSDRKAGL